MTCCWSAKFETAHPSHVIVAKLPNQENGVQYIINNNNNNNNSNKTLGRIWIAQLQNMEWKS